MKFGIISLAFVLGTTALTGCSSKSSPANDTSTTSASLDTPASSASTTSASLPTPQTHAHTTKGSMAAKTGVAATPASTAANNAPAAANAANTGSPQNAPAATLRGTGPLPPLTAGPPKLGADGKIFSCKSDGDCDSSEHCSSQHTCQCATEKGFSRCSPKAACTNVKNEDTNNCGVCGNVCDNILICSHGKCDEDL